MPTAKRTEIEMTRSIYESLKSGEAFTTTDGQIIPCTSDDIDFWTDKGNLHQRILNRRFNTLLEEFVKYIQFKNEDNPQNLVYAPQRRITAPR